MKTDFFDKLVKISLERFHSDFSSSFFILKRARATMIRVINYLTKKSGEMQEKNKIAPNHRHKNHVRFFDKISSFQKVRLPSPQFLKDAAPSKELAKADDRH